MSFKKRVTASLVLSFAICTGATTAHAADDGLITKPSKYSVEETVARFEAAVRQKEAAGFTVFTEIDHAAAAKKFGLDMRPRTLILFGNPKVGTPSVIKTPLLAIDLPPKALVWEDDQGKVWLSYNSADYLFNTIYKRHGAEAPPAIAPTSGSGEQDAAPKPRISAIAAPRMQASHRLCDTNRTACHSTIRAQTETSPLTGPNRTRTLRLHVAEYGCLQAR